MTKKDTDLIPKKVSTVLKEILNPLSPDSYEAAIRFLADEITSMFRELSEHRSSDEGKARQTLSRRQSRLLKKLQELFPESIKQVEDAYSLMSRVLEEQFERQRGRKYL